MLIGEVATRTGISARMLRHYDAIGLVTPSGRTAADYRDYIDEDLQRLNQVEGLRALGLSLAEVGRALDGENVDGAQLADIVQQLIRHTRERIAVEQELLTRLEHVDAAGPADWGEVLRVVGTLRALESKVAAHRQRAALAGTGGADNPGPLPVSALVAAVLHEDDLNIVGAIHWALARSDDVAGAISNLGQALESKDVHRRGRAVGALCALDDPAAIEVLARALDDPDVGIRERVALAIGQRGGAQSVPVLVDMVARGSGDVPAAEVLGVLSESVVPAVTIVESLRRASDQTQDAQLRLVQALAEIPGTGAIAALTELADHPDRNVALTAGAILDHRTS